MTRYFVGRIYERNGEYEFVHTVCFQLQSRKQPKAFMKDYAKNFYNTNYRSKSGDGWLFNGEIYVEEQGCHQCTEEEYKTLRKFGI